MRRATPSPAPLAALLLGACAGAQLTAEERALIQRADCASLLRAADSARAQSRQGDAAALARACPQAGLEALVASATPAEALLWCGRAQAAAGHGGKPGCDYKKVAGLKEALRPRLTLGPADASSPPDPLLLAALADLGAELNLAWDADPDVIVGTLQVEVEQQETSAFATATDAAGRRRQVPARNHRTVARAQAQLELAEKTRTLRATAEARDTTWEAVPRWGIAARAPPDVPPDQEMKRRGAAAWLRAAARALWLAPPETVDLDDARGCVAYGLALNAQSGDAEAAAHGRGDEARVATCERLLGEPPGAGLPVP